MDIIIVTTALRWQRSRVAPHALGPREFNRSPPVSYTHKGKLTCTFQGTASFPAKLLTKSQKMKEDDKGEEEEWAREASVTGQLHSYPPKPRVVCLLVSDMGASHSRGPLSFSVCFVPFLSEWDQNSLLSEDGQRAERKLALDNNNTHSYSFGRGWTSLFWEHREMNWV